MYRMPSTSDGQHSEPSMQPATSRVKGADQPIPPPPDCSLVPLPGRWDVSRAQLMQMDEYSRSGSTEARGHDFLESGGNHATIERDLEGGSGVAAHGRGNVLSMPSKAPRNSNTPRVDMQPPAENLHRHDSLVERPLGNEVPVTTLMVRNLPGRLRQEQVLEIWPPSERANYNLFYMPYDVNRGRTAGHTFMNFVTHDAAMEFWSRWQGRMFPSRGKKSAESVPIDIRVASRQGLDANIASWRQTLSYALDTRFLPAIIVAGKQFDFWYFVRCMDYAQCDRAEELTISHMVHSF